MRILYLYTEVMGYTIATIRELLRAGAEVHVVHWDRKRLSQYKLPEVAGASFYPRSSLGRAELIRLSEKLAPDVTVVSGWQDRDYLAACSTVRRNARAVVCGFDDQWLGTVRQRIGSAFGCLGGFRRFFSHAWVSGARQYEYARRFGFREDRIIFDLYSADLALFEESYRKKRRTSTKEYPHQFLFMGRLEPIKGVDALVEAWDQTEGARNDWRLVVVGDGTLRSRLEDVPGIHLTGFLQPESLSEEVSSAGCLLVPSLHEPWGVVVHEAAAAGLPLVASRAVGATASFLISGYNGFLHETGDPSSLARCMRRIVSLSDERLWECSELSHALAQRISPRTSAQNLLSVVT